MKTKAIFFASFIILFITSINCINGQNVEIEGGVKISNLPTSNDPQDLVTYNPDSTLGSISTTSLFQRLDFERNNASTYSFTDANGVVHSLEITNPTLMHGGATGINPNTHIAFVPVNANDSYLLFNIEGTSGACTVLHVEDDTPRKGMYFASDNGNSAVNVLAWGNNTTHTFMIRVEGNEGHVLFTNTSYALICF